MGTRFDSLNPRLTEFIAKQPMFFVATAAGNGRVNLSPKGMDSLRVLSPNRLVWLNLTGSGNETASHLQRQNRLTLMWCAFENPPMILRVYGSGRLYHAGDAFWEEHIGLFPAYTGARQLIEVTFDLVQTSCGFAVPLMEFQGQRSTLVDWADRKGEAGIKAYWEEKNVKSLDGWETDLESEGGKR